MSQSLQSELYVISPKRPSRGVNLALPAQATRHRMSLVIGLHSPVQIGALLLWPQKRQQISPVTLKALAPKAGAFS